MYLRATNFNHLTQDVLTALDKGTGLEIDEAIATYIAAPIFPLDQRQSHAFWMYGLSSFADKLWERRQEAWYYMDALLKRLYEFSLSRAMRFQHFPYVDELLLDYTRGEDPEDWPPDFGITQEFLQQVASAYKIVQTPAERHLFDYLSARIKAGHFDG